MTSKINEYPRELSFDILGIPPSTEEIEQAKEEEISVVTHYQSFSKKTMLCSVITLIMVASLAYFFNFQLVASVVVLFSFSAFLAVHGAFGSSTIFLFLSNFIVIFILNQNMIAYTAVCAGLVCLFLAYVRQGILRVKSIDADRKLKELEPVDEEALQILKAWSETYPACQYYFGQIHRMQRPVTRIEYEAAYTLVFELNKELASRFRTRFNYVPFFFG